MGVPGLSPSPEHSNRSSPSLRRHTKALSSSPPVTASVLVFGSRLTQNTEAAERGDAHTSVNVPQRRKPPWHNGYQRPLGRTRRGTQHSFPQGKPHGSPECSENVTSLSSCASMPSSNPSSSSVSQASPSGSSAPSSSKSTSSISAARSSAGSEGQPPPISAPTGPGAAQREGVAAPRAEEAPAGRAEGPWVPGRPWGGDATRGLPAGTGPWGGAARCPGRRRDARLTRPGRAQLHHLDDLLVAMEVQRARPVRGLHAGLPARHTPPPQPPLPPFSPASANPNPRLHLRPAPSSSTTRGFRTARRTLGNAVFYSFPAAPSAGSSSTADHASRHAAGPREPGTAQHGGSTRRTAR